jgi:hypothetical protein
MTRARGLALGFVALTLGALASLAPVAPAAPTCAAAGAHHAALVVEHGDGSVATRCVAFDTSNVTGEQLLTLSGIAWSGQTFGGFGDAVCALDGEPARYVDCPGKDSYWAVFVASGGGSWQLSNVGISSLVLRDGDAEGLRYVPAVGNPVAPTSPVGVCSATAPVSAAAPVSASPPAAKSTSQSTSRSTPTPTSAATNSPVLPTEPPSASPVTSAGELAVAAATAGSARGPGPNAPSAPEGPDAGLLAAFLAGVVLAGLAVLRLVSRRRQRR